MKPLTDVRATEAERLSERLVRDFASAFIRIRGAHNPNPGEPCAWCQLAAEQAAEAMVTADPLRRLLVALPADGVIVTPDSLAVAVQSVRHRNLEPPEPSRCPTCRDDAIRILATLAAEGGPA